MNAASLEIHMRIIEAISTTPALAVHISVPRTAFKRYCWQCAVPLNERRG